MIPRDEDKAAIGGAAIEKVIVALADPQRALVIIEHRLDREPAHPLAHIGQRFRLGAKVCIGAIVERVGQRDDVGIVVRVLVILFEIVGGVIIGVGAAIVQVGPIFAAIEVACKRSGVVARKMRLQKVVIHLLDVQIVALQTRVDVERHKAGIRGGQPRALEQVVGQRFAAQLVAHQIDALPILELARVGELDSVRAGPDIARALAPVAHADVVVRAGSVNKSRVQQNVGIEIAGDQLGPVLLCHNQPVDGQAAAGRRVLHQVEVADGNGQPGLGGDGARRAVRHSARGCFVVAGGDVELDVLAIALGRDEGGVDRATAHRQRGVS